MEQTILLVIQVLSAFALIGLILIQQGKGADAGASFGGGASQTVFGSSGSGNFLTKSTSLLATVFFATSLLLAYFTKQSIETATESSLFEGVAIESELPVVPAADSESANELPVIDEKSVTAESDSQGAVDQQESVPAISENIENNASVIEEQSKQSIESEGAIDDNADPAQ